MSLSLLEAQIQMVLDRASNNEPVEIPDEWIDDAGEQFKTALRKQFTPREGGFRLRMSNIGRPLCQLQMDKAGTKQARMPYNHVVRMLLGDSLEVIIRLILRACGANVTSDGDKVVLDVLGEQIKGESDIDLGGKVYDVKSTSPWAFTNKWQRGYRGLAEHDDFGYVAQLFGYADAQGKEAGGWIVGNKSTGELLVVEVDATEEEVAQIRKNREEVVAAIRDGRPFERCFEPEEETYYGKPTGAKKLPKSCTFCNFQGECWPDAKHLPPPKSKSKSPTYQWYTEYPEAEIAD